MTTNLRAYMARQAAKYKIMAGKQGRMHNCTNCGKAEYLLFIPENRIYTCETCRYWDAYNV